MEVDAINNSLKMSIPPAWAELENIRSKTRSFLQENGLASNQLDALEMVACELTENAIKYGDYSSQNPSIDFHIDVSNSSVIIEVKHKINSENQNLQTFDSRIQWIRGFQNPFQAYVERLKYVSAKQLVDAESGLGLVRIAYEGRSILDFYLSEDNTLAVSAVYKLSK